MEILHTQFNGKKYRISLWSRNHEWTNFNAQVISLLSKHLKKSTILYGQIGLNDFDFEL